nr:hypothetical protein 345p3_00037 [Serratia entomophila]
MINDGKPNRSPLGSFSEAKPITAPIIAEPSKATAQTNGTPPIFGTMFKNVQSKMLSMNSIFFIIIYVSHNTLRRIYIRPLCCGLLCLLVTAEIPEPHRQSREASNYSNLNKSQEQLIPANFL